MYKNILFMMMTILLQRYKKNSAPLFYCPLKHQLFNNCYELEPRLRDYFIEKITDMDGKEIDRSLLSIKAELDKRKRLFAERREVIVSALKTVLAV